MVIIFQCFLLWTSFFISLTKTLWLCNLLQITAQCQSGLILCLFITIKMFQILLIFAWLSTVWLKFISCIFICVLWAEDLLSCCRSSLHTCSSAAHQPSCYHSAITPRSLYIDLQVCCSVMLRAFFWSSCSLAALCFSSCVHSDVKVRILGVI